MNNLIDLITDQLGDQGMHAIGQQLGADNQQTKAAIGAALPMLIGAMSRNASSQQGASSLLNALTKDHDGAILNDLSGFLGNADAGPGAGILKHVLGRKQAGAEQFVSKSSGLNAQSSANLLKMLAPILMGVLGKQQRQANLGTDGLSSMLNSTRQQAERQSSKEMGLINMFLDKDGDGDISDDVMGMGMKFLGGLLGGKR